MAYSAMVLDTTMQTIVARLPQVPASLLDGQGMLVSTKRGEAVVVNGVGYFIWQKLETPSTIADLANTLVAEYGISPPQAVEDVRRYIQRLQALELVQCS